MVRLLLCMGLAAGALAGQARDDRAEVRQALLDYVNGFTDGDSTLLVRSISPQVVKYGYWKDGPDAAYVGEPMTWDQIRSWHSATRRPNPPRDVEVYDVQDQTASGFVRAWWGTDYILLAREDGRWKVRMVLWQGPLP